MINASPNSWGRLVLPAALVLALAACGNKSQPPCPDVNVLDDASKFTQFKPGEGRDITDIVLQGEIVGFKGTCAYDKDDKKLTVVMQVQMEFTHGPAATTRDAQVQYFVAVPSYYPKPQAKQVEDLKFTFANAADHVRITDNEVDVVLPVKDLSKDVDKMSIYIGFQLDQAQLDYNRSLKAK